MAIIDVSQNNAFRGLSQLGQQFLQASIAKQQLELQERAQELAERQQQMKEQQFKTEQEQLQAAQAAQAQQAMMSAQQDPQFLQMLQGLQATQPQVAQRVQLAAQQGQLDPASIGNANQQFQGVPGMTFLPGEQPAMASNAALAAAEQARLQRQRQEAEIGQIEAEAGYRERATEFFDTQEAVAESEVALNEARAAGIPREIAVAEQNAATNAQEAETRRIATAISATQDMMQSYGALTQLLGPGMASRRLFGADQPDFTALMQQNAEMLDLASAVPGGPEAQLEFLEEQRLTNFAGRVGLASEERGIADQALEMAEGDMQEALDSLMTDESIPEETKQRLAPRVLMYYTLRADDPSQVLQLRENNPGWFDKILGWIVEGDKSLAGAAGGAVAGGMVGGPPGALLGGSVGAAMGGGIDLYEMFGPAPVNPLSSNNTQP